MSPLLDVTNTEVVTLNEERPSGVIKPDVFIKTSKNSVTRNNRQNDKEFKCNSSGVRRLAKKKKLRNQQVSKSIFPSSNERGNNVCTNGTSKLEIPPQSSSPQCKDVRVPPLPDVEFLSKAVETLSIATEDKWHQNSSQFKAHIKNSGKNAPTIDGDILKQSFERQKIPEEKFLNQCPQDGKLPVQVCSGTYQCVACKLEFSNVDNLTTHLVKHVYEGLHAAAWLNNAMTTLLCPVTTTNPQTIPTSLVTKTTTSFPSDHTNSSE